MMGLLGPDLFVQVYEVGDVIDDYRKSLTGCGQRRQLSLSFQWTSFLLR